MQIRICMYFNCFANLILDSEIDTEEMVSAEDNSILTPPTEELVEQIMENIWKYNDCYSVSNVVWSGSCYSMFRYPMLLASTSMVHTRGVWLQDSSFIQCQCCYETIPAYTDSDELFRYVAHCRLELWRYM